MMKMTQKNRRRGNALLAALFLAVMAGMAWSDSGTGADQDKEALTIMVRNNQVQAALERAFPDIPFAFEHYDGKNPSTNLQIKIRHHDITDIYMGTLPLAKEDAQANLIDLSSYTFCENFEPSILNECDIDGHIYQLPTAISIRCIIYNKEMFREHGWEEPKTFDELTALCRRIRAETEGIVPIIFAGAGKGYYFTAMTTYAQTEFLYTPEGAVWEKEYLAGRASAEEGFGRGIQMVQELIDAGAFDLEKNGTGWDVDVFKAQMATGQAAMQFAWGNQNQLFGLVDNESQKYEVMPFRNYDGDGFLGTSGFYYIGLSKALEEKGNEKKLERALRVMEWFSTEEGQKAMNEADGSIIYPLVTSDNMQTIPQFRKLWYDNLDGIKASMLYVGYEDIIVPTGEYIMEGIEGKHDLSGLADFIDVLHADAIAQNVENEKAYMGSFARNFTHSETVQLVADIIQSAGNSDITLISDGERIGKVKNFEGVHARFYEGLFPYEWASVMLPGTEIADNKIMQLTLTGAEIQDLLEHGKQVALFEGSNYPRSLADAEGAIDTERYPYFWSGMSVKKGKNGKVTAMTLENGVKMRPEETYTVSFVYRDYMDTTETAGKPVELGYSMMDVFAGYLRANSPINPGEVNP